ncbi:MAG: tyrosine-type recombinase/integrase [Actinomycetota bacterium]|nr:tyrosine-type recombinase/integrase [Actinomycetota bacterium]
MRVYAGIDPVSKKKHYLVETVPTGPTATRDAERVRTRLLNQVDERRNPRTKATVNQLLDRWLEVAEMETTTRNSVVGRLDRHVRPVLGAVSVSRLDAETLESLYAELRRCRDRCGGRRQAGHACRPLAPATIRLIHANLSAALSSAVRWRWLAVNPAAQAAKPTVPKSDPQPPSGHEAARIVVEAWKDPDWGMLVWLAMVTGARRGELCALRWDSVDFTTSVLQIRTSIAQQGAHIWEKDTKTHQQRRITLDPQTLALLTAYHARRMELAAAAGMDLLSDARIFSPVPDGSVWVRPDTVGQRYARMCARLGWKMHLHQLRHYSATELIAAGVDVRTVAGRLGHGGGGTTTLKVYSAWRSEADQRAAGSLGMRMPALPMEIDPATPLTGLSLDDDEDASPHRRITADLRGAIACGAFQPGDLLPTLAEIARRYDVATSTVHRAFATLKDAGLIEVRRGKRAVVSPGTT